MIRRNPQPNEAVNNVERRVGGTTDAGVVSLACLVIFALANIQSEGSVYAGERAASKSYQTSQS